MKSDFKKIQSKRVKKAIESIDKIEVKIHRMVVTGPYLYPDIEKAFGPLKPNNGVISKKRMGVYNDVSPKRIKGVGYVTAFYNTFNPYCPSVRIEFSSPTKNFLIDLYDKLPRLNVSRIEYTIDLFPYHYDSSGKSISKAVRNLYSVLKRHLYFPRQRRNIFHFRDKAKKRKVVHDPKKMNEGWRVNEVQGYERGPNEFRKYYKISSEHSQKIGKTYYWPRKYVDRVRLEYNTPRKKLRKHYLTSLLDFIQIPKFREINENVYSHFLRFTSEDFYNGHLYGKKSFQELYIEAQKKPGDNEKKGKNGKRKQVTNIRQCIEEVPEFRKLKKMLVAAMIDFEEMWDNDEEQKLAW